MYRKLIGVIVLFCTLIWQVPCLAEEGILPYEVAVNVGQNIVIVYAMDEKGDYLVIEKTFACSSGEDTPLGTFHTSDQYVWRPLFGNVYGQYATRITGHILFHSVPYLKQDKSTLKFEEYNKLGETASDGCIRMTVEDAKWIYDNCPYGTTVNIYKSNELQPLLLPNTLKIDYNDPRRNWDPTDPDVDNPWKKGTVFEMNMEIGKTTRKIETFYQDGNYALLSEDAQLLFGLLGVTIILPEDVEKLQAEGDVEVLFQCQKRKVSYYIDDGKVYFNLEDLGRITGTKVSWDTSFQEMDLEYQGTEGENQVKLFLGTTDVIFADNE
ncbi:L,D-transpeptidase [Anaerotignum sp.]|uniref:L,D-transpeptidase n=1 Tax=Anaerotignum sp. TaxID=2039241 RepID=UPI002714F514|nr:L,D-transpeptidase [Anaerotignum sp.]